MNRYYIQAACTVLWVLQIAMLLALYTQTAPHPPLEVRPFALGPFISTSIAIAIAASLLTKDKLTLAGKVLALLAAAFALVSYGPHKYFDPAFSLIWPAVICAQLAILVIVVFSLKHKKTPD